METIKMQVQREVLAQLNDIIDNEVSAMEDHYTVAEIAGEVLLQLAENINKNNMKG